jgi:hypothetical protein
VNEHLGSWGNVAGAIAAILVLLFMFWRGAKWAVHASEDLAEIRRNAEQTNRAVNHQPAGTPPLAVQVSKIAEGLDAVADEADRKHEENQASISRLTRDVERLVDRMGTIGRALGMDEDPWDPSQGERRRR